MKTIEITRIVVKSKRGYFVPARYSTATKFIALTENEEIEVYCGGSCRTFNQFITAIQNRVGGNYQYNIDRSKPYVHYT